MHIFILTLGTRGDLELFLMLGRELGSRGHRVVLGTSEFYSARVREARVEWAQIGDGTQDQLVSILQSLSPIQDKTRRTYLYYQRWLRPQLSMAMGHITSLGAGTDYFISNLKMVLRRGDKIIPGTSVTYDPPGAIEDLPKYGTQKHNGMILDLVAMNKTLVDPEDRWGAQYRFTGFWRDEGRSPSEQPAELVDFLDNGPPPVVITMGSMVMFDTNKLVRDVTQALGVAGQRGIIVVGWSGISHVDGSPAPVLCASEVHYDWLFPKASCVIHHGGCGTVAAVLQAGKPSIVLPQITCQEHFGKMLLRENLATGIFDAHALDPGDLGAAIQRAVTDERANQSARYWQGAVSEERGVEAAADFIEAHWKQIR